MNDKSISPEQHNKEPTPESVLENLLNSDSSPLNLIEGLNNAFNKIPEE